MLKKDDTVVISSIKKSQIFYDEKDNSNKIIIDGSIFNTQYNLKFFKKYYQQKFN